MNTDKSSVVPIREQIYQRIKDAILTNEFKPGDVVQIDRLAREFGVSATPIRETLIRLENSGLLTLIPNKGAVVTEFTEKDVKDTWEMRRVLEPYAGRITAGLDVADETARIESRVREILAGDYNLSSYIQTDSDLHKLLFTHIDNVLLKETIERIHHLSIRMRYFAESVTQDHRHVMEEVCKEHLEILQALKEGNPDAAETAVRRHIEHSERRTLSSAHVRDRLKPSPSPGGKQSDSPYR